MGYSFSCKRIHYDVTFVNRYPSKHEITPELARSFKFDPRRILVTAGADDALDRACERS